ncbi:hypothetical protein PVAND_007024 [Polypedilum vanderplanki]|uniref:Uncharacterized protein n=1 Tax=Polypedilum vanderplanki TaxID=319348 RepID=A0A9J6C4Z2_POLVA|nr:hypothetical protein PVAND_007024 [Polypedilum vanderplanki]
MNARDLVGLANDHEGLDFDINSYKRTGLGSTKENLLSLGTENSKKVVVDGMTHDNEDIRIEESHVNKFKLSPFSRRNLIDGKGPIEYENSKTTNLQIGDQFIEKRDEEKLGKSLIDSANRAIVHVQEKIIKKALNFVVKKVL